MSNIRWVLNSDGHDQIMIDHCNYDLIDFIDNGTARQNSIIIDHSPADSFLCATLKPTLHVFQILLFNNNDNI